jgi:hypothetical protein
MTHKPISIEERGLCLHALTGSSQWMPIRIWQCLFLSRTMYARYVQTTRVLHVLDSSDTTTIVSEWELRRCITGSCAMPQTPASAPVPCLGSCERTRVIGAPPASGVPGFEPRTGLRCFQVPRRPCGACPLVWLRVSQFDKCVDVGVCQVSPMA